MQADDDGKNLLLYINVCWLSRSKFLERFILLIYDVGNFLPQKGDDYLQLCEKLVIRFIIFVDFFLKQYNLNLELQGNNRHDECNKSNCIIFNFPEEKFKSS